MSMFPSPNAGEPSAEEMHNLLDSILSKKEIFIGYTIATAILLVIMFYSPFNKEADTKDIETANSNGTTSEVIKEFHIKTN